MTYALGIDLGTTFTAAAIWRDGRAETVALADRAHTVPSALLLRSDGVMLVGDAAARRGMVEPERLARGFKRRLGDDAPLLLGDAAVSAQELTGHLLRWVVGTVTEREGEPPAHVTLTCPATWGDYRRRLMTEAAEAAQLVDVGLLEEPVAAAVYYAAQERLRPETVVAVYDLGGGTFDATVVAKTSDGFEIRGTPGGDETIGGTDFDQAVMDHVASTLRAAWADLDVTDPVVLAGLAQVRENAVEAKEALSTDTEATVPVILPDLSRHVRITRGEFEPMIRIPVLQTVDVLARTIEAAGLEPADLTAVLLVGGSSRIPLVSRLLASELGIPVTVDAHPKYAVCLGAAIAGAVRLTQPQRRPRSPALPEPQPTWPAVTPQSPRAGSAPEPGGVAPAQATGSDPPAARGAEGVELLAGGPPRKPPPNVAADLASSGIRAPVDVALSASPDLTRPVPELSDQDVPLTVHHTGDSARGRRIAAVVTVAVVILLAVASIVAAAISRHATPPGAAPDTAPGSAGPSAAAASAPAATLRQQPVPKAVGDVMRAVAAGPETLVAVGESTASGVPRAWLFRSGRWSSALGPAGQTERRGGMNGVAAAGDLGFVAVGWSAPRSISAPARGERAAAIWRSTDGVGWQLVATPRLGELFDVAALPNGGFVATGVSWSTDQESGDAAILTSADGTTWRAVSTVGLDGAGPTTLRRLLPTPGGGAIAVGTRLDGSVSRSGLWTSANLHTWSESALLPAVGPGAVSAWGLGRLRDGRLIAVGSASTLDGGTAAAVWVGRSATTMLARPVPQTAAGLYAVVGTAPAGTTAVGTAQSPAGTVAAAWTITAR